MNSLNGRIVRSSTGRPALWPIGLIKKEEEGLIRHVRPEEANTLPALPRWPESELLTLGEA